MGLEAAVYARLKAILPATPIYPRPRRQGCVLPCVEYKVDGLDVPSHLDGADGTAEASLSVRFVGPRLVDLEALAESVRKSLPAIGTSWSGLAIDACIADDDGDEDTPLPDGRDDRDVEIVLSFTVLYQL